MKRLLLFTMLVMSFISSVAYSQWVEAPSLPGEIDWAMNASLNGKIYVFGGLSSAALNTVFTYTPGENAIKRLTAVMPKAKCGGYAAAVNGKIYIVGGMTVSGNDLIANNETYEFDPATEKFTKKTAMPSKVGFFAGAEVNGKIYVIGGAGKYSVAVDSTSIQIYDPATDTWTVSETQAPYSGRFIASATQNGKIYLLGGSDGNSYLKDAWKGTPNGSTITWESVANLPKALTRGSAGSVSGKIVFTGGVNASSPTDYSNTYLYDEGTNTWVSSYALPIASYNAGQLFGTGTDLYFVGGYANAKSFKYTVPVTPGPAMTLVEAPSLVNIKHGESQTVSYSVKNLGPVALTLSIAIPDAAKPWLSVPNSTVTVNPFTTSSLTFTVSAANENVGFYHTDVAISSNDNLKPTSTEKIFLSVIPDNIVGQNTKVLLEEGTGDWCGYCPQGHEIAQALKDQYGDDFIALNYHGGSATEPYMITDGQNLLQDLNIQGYPNAAIQRRLFEGQPVRMTNRGDWVALVDEVFSSTPTAPVAINLPTYTFDQATGNVHAVVELQTAQAVMNVRLTTVVSENGIEAQQEDYRTPSPYWIDYVHNAIVRQMVPGEFGATLTVDPQVLLEGTVIPVNTKINQTVDFTVTNKVTVAKNSDITFIVNSINPDGTLGDVLQVFQRPLLDASSSVKIADAGSEVKTSNYPNPAASSTKFMYSVTERGPVSLVIRDIMGREVAAVVSTQTQDAGTYEADFNVSNLANGIYTYVLTSGNKTVTSTLNVVK